MNLTTLEQSKKLKEWGAPQKDQNKDSGYFYIRGELICQGHGSTIYTSEEMTTAYDLESLIEWLGDRFLSIKRYDPDFLATGLSEYIDDEINGGGETPLEAVYNLASALFDTKLTSKEGK